MFHLTNLTRRITGRRTCKKCGEIYNIYSKPSKVEGVCDVCGGELTQRKDDNEESLKVRLDEYAKNTEPVIAYYEEKNMVSKNRCVKIYGRNLARFKRSLEKQVSCAYNI